MKLIKPSFEILEQPSGLEGVYKQIERAGRVCYKSENKITEDSAKPFVDRMIKSGHGAMLEHGTVYLAMPIETIIPIEANGWGKYTKAPYSKGFKVCSVDGEKRVAVTTNYRVLVENNWLDDLKYLCEPTEYHAKRITVHFVCDRGVSHKEFVA
jgi:thymidylate synthase (FAD)